MPEIKMHPTPVRVRSTKPRGFWRAGRHFGPHWQEYPAGEFTLDQITALKAEPMLVVEEMAAPGGDRTVAVEAVTSAAGDAQVESLAVLGGEEPDPADNGDAEAEPGRRKKGK